MREAGLVRWLSRLLPARVRELALPFAPNDGHTPVMVPNLCIYRFSRPTTLSKAVTFGVTLGVVVQGEKRVRLGEHTLTVDPKTLPSGVHITHENLFDNSNEGIAVANKPIFSVQYHPEASPGPHDASYLFARFRDELKRGK